MTRVAIAAPNEQAARAAELTVEAGGNAVDAAVAACLVAMVNEVGIVSLSSGGFVSMSSPEHPEPFTIDGWMDMPGRGRKRPRDKRDTGTWDVWTDYGGGVEVTIGPGSVAAHGAIAALGDAHQRAGQLPWAELFGPAIEVARSGINLGGASRYYLDYVHESIFGWDKASWTAVHDANGEVTQDLIRLPGLVETLERIAAYGPQEMHTGETARAIAADVQARGGILSLVDLSEYRTVTRPSLLVKSGEWTLGTNPPPAVGGAVVAAMLKLMDSHGLEDREHIIRVQRQVLSHRLTVFDASDELERDVVEYLALVDQQPLSVLESGSTAHVSTTDELGNACAVTISSGYGSGMIAKDTGIWLNNCLGEQELNPRGLHGASPGTRLLSNMAPTVARAESGGVLAIGSPGADRITTAVSQVLTGIFNDGLSLQEAINYPRIHVHRAGRPDEEIKVEDELTMYFGGVGAAMRHPDGELEVAADPRREGAVRIVKSRI